MCNLVFAQKSHLTLHMKTHRSTQPSLILGGPQQVYAKPLVQTVLSPPPSHITKNVNCPVVPDECYLIGENV